MKEKVFKDKIIFGAFEKVSLPSLKIKDVVAKIDTGAYSGAMHCPYIELVKKRDGKKVLRFIPLDSQENLIETTSYVKSYVKSSSGHRLKRYLFDTNIVINNITYKIRIGLSDRSDMGYEILIGRRFLRENNILVDVKHNLELDIDMEKKNENRNFIKRQC